MYSGEGAGYHTGDREPPPKTFADVGVLLLYEAFLFFHAGCKHKCIAMPGMIYRTQVHTAGRNIRSTGRQMDISGRESDGLIRSISLLQSQIDGNTSCRPRWHPFHDPAEKTPLYRARFAPMAPPKKRVLFLPPVGSKAPVLGQSRDGAERSAGEYFEPHNPAKKTPFFSHLSVVRHQGLANHWTEQNHLLKNLERRADYARLAGVESGLRGQNQLQNRVSCRARRCHGRRDGRKTRLKGTGRERGRGYGGA